MHTYTHTHIHTYTPIHIHTYTHTHIRTCTHTNVPYTRTHRNDFFTGAALLMTLDRALGARPQQNPRVFSNQRSTAYLMILSDAPEGSASVDQRRAMQQGPDPIQTMIQHNEDNAKRKRDASQTMENIEHTYRHTHIHTYTHTHRQTLPRPHCMILPTPTNLLGPS